MTAWSDLSPGDRVAWMTPSFFKLGVVQRIKGRSAKILFDGELKARVIPDARWYWAQANAGDPENSLVRWTDDRAALAPAAISLSQGDDLSVKDAVALFGVAAKDLRRWLRSGKVLGRQQDGLWVVDAKSLGKHLAERR